MLIVVGSGLAGSWLTRVARARGVEAILVGDEAEPPTTAAVGLLRPTHLPEADRPLLPKSLRAWSEHGIAVHAGAQVSRWDGPGVKYQQDWFVVDPHRSCLPADVVGRATALAPGHVRVGDAELRGTVVWCDGNGAGRRTYGVTWVHPDPRAVKHPLAVHHLAPYKVLAAASFPTGCRLGSSSTADPATATANGLKLLAAAVANGLTDSVDGWYPVRGTRLHRPQTLAPDGPFDAYRWSGFHRTGFGVVPAQAQHVLRTVLS